MSNNENIKKPVFKRVWFWLLMSPVIVVVLLFITTIIIGLSGGFDEGMEAGAVAAQSVTVTVNPTAAPTIAPVPTPTSTPLPTPTPTPTPSPTAKPTVSPTPTPNASEAPYGLDINGNSGPDFIALISYFEYALEDITGQNVRISYMRGDWEIGKANFRYILTTNCKIGQIRYDVIMKMEFDEKYETYEVFQLKIDGHNIDF